MHFTLDSIIRYFIINYIYTNINEFYFNRLVHYHQWFLGILFLFQMSYPFEIKTVCLKCTYQILYIASMVLVSCVVDENNSCSCPIGIVSERKDEFCKVIINCLVHVHEVGCDDVPLRYLTLRFVG